MFRSDFRCVSSKLFSEAEREDAALPRREPSRRRDKDLSPGVGPTAGPRSQATRTSIGPATTRRSPPVIWLISDGVAARGMPA